MNDELELKIKNLFLDENLGELINLLIQQFNKLNDKINELKKKLDACECRVWDVE